MNEARDTLVRSVEPLLRKFAERVVAHDPAVRPFVSSHSNDAYLLLSGISFLKTNDGDSMAANVNAAYRDGEIALSCDACMDTGEMLTEGPEAIMPVSEMVSLDHTQLAEWLERFKAFLASSEAVVKERVATL